jgi:hypothetical protein
MKKFLLTIIVVTLFASPSFAEVIGAQKEERVFGEWKLLCENDVMVDVPYCQIASKFYQDQAAISLDASLKIIDQLVMVIPNLKLGETVKIRIDKNDVIFSNPTKKSDFGLVVLGSKQKFNILSQMKKGDFLFIRFNIASSEKEITVKLNLRDFRSAVSFYNSKFSH